MEQDWNSTLYAQSLKIARELTTKGILIALNQESALKPEVSKAYRDVLKARGEEYLLDAARRDARKKGNPNAR